MAGQFTTEAFALLGIGLCVIFFRTYCRVSTVGLKNLQIDDYVMLLAAVVYSLETAAAFSVGYRFHGLANSGMTEAQRATLGPVSQEWELRVGGSKLQLIGWSLYTLLLWLLKFTLLVFYSRLTEGVNGFETKTRIGFGLLLSTYISTELSILFGCGLPFNKNWQIYPDPGNYCQPAISKVDILVTVVLNVSTDAYLLSLPLPLLWRANLPLRKKAALFMIFFGGVFVMAAGILRCVLILINPVTGAEEAGSWAVRETFVAVLTSNLPIVYPYIRGQALLFLELPIISSLKTRITNSASHMSTSINHKGDGNGLDSAARVPRFSKWGPGLTSLGSKMEMTAHATEAESETEFVLQQFPSTKQGHQGDDIPTRPDRPWGLELQGERDLERGERQNSSDQSGSEDEILPIQVQSGHFRQSILWDNLRAMSFSPKKREQNLPEAIAITTDVTVDVKDMPLSAVGVGSMMNEPEGYRRESIISTFGSSPSSSRVGNRKQSNSSDHEKQLRASSRGRERKQSNPSENEKHLRALSRGRDRKKSDSSEHEKKLRMMHSTNDGHF